MNYLKRKVFANLKNIGFPNFKRKLIIFESDDWGSNRISSLEDYNQLVQEKILSENTSHYNKYDTIADSNDLELLLEVLSNVKDANNHHAIFTTFVNVANPDFTKIEQSGFQKYYWEDFFETSNRLGIGKQVQNLWERALKSRLFDVAFHGREHLCVPLWLRFLKDEDSLVRKAFKYRFYSVPIQNLPQKINEFRPAFYFSTFEETPFLKESIIQGIGRLEKLVNKKIKVFCPPNGISHKLFDEVSSTAGIESVVSNRFRSEPDGKGNIKKRYYRYGSKNRWQQFYYYRNSMFEPTFSSNAVDICLLQIAAAFRWNKPAIISTHRVNYIGRISPQNRDKGLRELNILLKNIVKIWPDAEFISSNEFSDILHRKTAK